MLSQDILKLSWIVKSRDIAIQAVHGDKVIEDEDLESWKNTKSDSFRDKMITCVSLEKYCTKESFPKMNEIVSKCKRKKVWRCGLCCNVLTGRSISCDRCLVWYHFKCSTVVKNNKDPWFCTHCIAEVQQGRKVFE